MKPLNYTQQRAAAANQENFVVVVFRNTDSARAEAYNIKNFLYILDSS